MVDLIYEDEVYAIVGAAVDQFRHTVAGLEKNGQ
jgi:hypothetical protein